MKKVLLSLGAALLMAAGAQAQTSYGLKAGVNLGKYSNVDDAKNNTSFYVTGFADLPIATNFSIQPGVSLQGKGNKVEGSATGVTGSATINTMSIEIPVNAVYYIPTGSGSLFLGAGPYVGFNVSGEQKLEGSFLGASGSAKSDIEFGSADNEMKTVEAGANFLGGYKFSNGFLINAGYGLGMTNLYNTGDTRSNRVLSFGVGFQF